MIVSSSLSTKYWNSIDFWLSYAYTDAETEDDFSDPNSDASGLAGRMSGCCAMSSLDYWGVIIGNVYRHAFILYIGANSLLHLLGMADNGSYACDPYGGL